MQQVKIRLDDGGFAACGKCGHELLESNGMSADAHQDRDDYEQHNPTGFRGEYVVVPFGCPSCGQHQALVTGNHKGYQYIQLFLVEPGEQIGSLVASPGWSWGPEWTLAASHG